MRIFRVRYVLTTARICYFLNKTSSHTKSNFGHLVGGKENARVEFWSWGIDTNRCLLPLLLLLLLLHESTYSPISDLAVLKCTLAKVCACYIIILVKKLEYFYEAHWTLHYD